MPIIQDIITTILAIIGACTFARKFVDYCEKHIPT